MKYFIIALLLFSTPAFALKFVEAPLIINGDMSTATINSPGTDLSFIEIGSMHVLWTGVPVGTIIVQVSDDIVATQNLVTHWTTFAGSSVAVSGPGDLMINFSNAGYRWIRLQYTKTSGTGTLNAIIDTKGDY